MKSLQRTYALAAGISLVIMALSAAFSYGYVLSGLEVKGDPDATFAQLISKASLFRASLGGWLLIFLTDLIVSFALYLFFKETRKSVSLATLIARLLYTAVLGTALIRLISLLPLLNKQGIDAAVAGSQVLSTLQSFEFLWSLGLIIFGLHLLGLGYLSILYRQIPNLFGYLLLLAGLAYMLIHASENLGLREEMVQKMVTILMIPMALSEILLAFWLIIRGGRIRKSRL